MSTTLNMTLLLRRAEFADSCILAAGEPGYHTKTKELKIGDGITAWAQLPFANESQIRDLIAAGVAEAKAYADTLVAAEKKDREEAEANFKTKQAEYSAEGSTVKTVTGVTQNANGEIDVTFDEIDFPILAIAGEHGTAITVDNTNSKNPVIGFGIDNTGNVVLSQSENGLSANINLSAYKTDAENEEKYKQLQDAIAKKVTATNEFVDTVAQNANGEIEITTKSVDFSNYYTKAEIDLLPHENTAHTHADGAGTKVTAAGGIDGEVKVNLNVAFEVSGNTVTMYDKDDADKTALATIDATSFIKDGMLHDVEYDPDTNKLTFTWNTDAGEKTDEVTLTDIIDPYVFEAGALLDVAIDGTKVTYSHEIVAAPAETAGEGRKYLTGVTTDGYGHITGFTTASEVDQDLSGYKTKQEVYNNAGTNKKTITNVSQDENGEIEVTYSDIDFSHDHDAQYKVIQTAINAVETDANEFIDTVAQDAQGVITVTTKKVDFSAAIQEAKDYADGLDHEDTTYTFEATENALEFTVTPDGKGEAQTIKLVAPTVDTGVMSITEGTDIVVTPGDDGEVEIAHKTYTTGEYTRTPDTSAYSGDQYFFTGITAENGHVTGANVRSLGDAIAALFATNKFTIDGGTSAN